MSEIQTDENQLSTFALAFNSMMDNLENVVVNFQKTLLLMLEKIEKLESMEKSLRDNIALYEKERDTEKIKQLTSDTTISAETPHQKPVETHKETEITKIQRSASTTVGENDASKRSLLAGTFSKIIKKVSSKSSYCILAIALAILGIIIVKLCLILFH